MLLLAAAELEHRVKQNRTYVFMAPWPVEPGRGVNNVVIGLSEAMRGTYDPAIVVTGWDVPPRGQIWLKMPTPTVTIPGMLGFVVRLLPNLIRLRRILRNAVAVNPHFPGLEILPVAILRKLHLAPKLIISVHGADVTAALDSSDIAFRLYRWLFRSADLIIACSEALASKVRRIVGDAKVVAVWNGVTPPDGSREERPIQAPYLVSVAAFVRKKGHDVLVGAFRSIVAARSDLKVALIGGDGPEREAIVQLIKRYELTSKVIVMVNLPQEAVWLWVRHADCFVLPSRDEPFGIAILEAALLRTPVVATCVGGVPEFLKNGVHGLLCPPDDPVALERAICTVLSDPASTQARVDAFYEHASQFTWSRAFEEYRVVARLP